MPGMASIWISGICQRWHTFDRCFNFIGPNQQAWGQVGAEAADRLKTVFSTDLRAV